jgi:hypothetical protein
LRHKTSEQEPKRDEIVMGIFPHEDRLCYIGMGRCNRGRDCWWKILDDKAHIECLAPIFWEEASKDLLKHYGYRK